MSNPPPARSWFRLPALGRQAQPKPPSPQQPRPPVLRPAFAQSFRPTQPQPQPQPRSPQPPPPPAPTTTTTTPQPPSPSPQQPRPSVLRPAFAQSFRPTQPQPQPRSPQPPTTTTTTPQPPSPSPPPPRPVAAPSRPVVTSQPPRVVSSPTPPMTSPKTVNAASSAVITKQSPNKAQVSEETQPPPPPSSLNSMTNTFPPKSSSYPAIESPGAIKPLPKTSPPPPISFPLKGEPTKVLVQAAFNKQAIVPSYSSKYGNVKEADRQMLSSFSEDGTNMMVLTIGGENKGANMELGFFSRRSTGGKQTEFNGSGNVGNEAQESQDVHKGMAKSSRLPMNAFVNSNTQSVNSSILLDSSVTEHDPGVHFYISKKPTKGIGKSNGGDEIGLKNNENRNPSLGEKE